MTRIIVLAGAALVAFTLSSVAHAQEPAAPADEPAVEAAEGGEGEVDMAALKAAIHAKLEWKTGEVVLEEGLATLKLGDQWRYLDPDQSGYVLSELWGNPPGPPTLGMIFPKDLGPLDEEGWAVIVTFSQDGYVEDDDATDIDYDELLGEMKEDTKLSNEERRAGGYQTVDLVGWAEPPRYDQAAKKLYWAKELKFEGQEVNTLNYDVRVLGRRGYLMMQAVAEMPLLPRVREGMQDVLTLTDFNSGHRYEDFDADLDEVAAYGIGALVAGKLAAKTGMLAALFAVILKAKKLVIIAVIGVIALLGKIFKRD